MNVDNGKLTIRGSSTVPELSCVTRIPNGRIIYRFFQKRAQTQRIAEWIYASLVFDLYRNTHAADRQHKVNFLVRTPFGEMSNVQAVNR